MMPSQIFNVGKFGTEVNHSASTIVIVNETTFNEMLFETASSVLNLTINKFGDFLSFEDMVKAGLNLEVELGFGNLYHELNNST